MKKAFFIVGHKSFGKSKTLVELTGAINSRNFFINDHHFTIQRRSNDDIGDELLDIVKEFVKEAENEFIILAFCPDFDDKQKRSEKIIQTFLEKSFEVYFFVLHKQYGGDEVVKGDELEKLKTYGTVYLYTESTSAKKRAAALKKFIKENIATGDNGI
jgi:predicted KAP-like P-loop ATPase